MARSAQCLKMALSRARVISPQRRFVEGLLQTLDQGELLGGRLENPPPRGLDLFVHVGTFQFCEAADVERGELVAFYLSGGNSVEKREGVSRTARQRIESHVTLGGRKAVE